MDHIHKRMNAAILRVCYGSTGEIDITMGPKEYAEYLNSLGEHFVCDPKYMGQEVILDRCKSGIEFRNKRTGEIAHA